MSTDLENRLRGSLGEHTSAVRPPAVDVAALVQRGRRRRGLRSGGAALVTAALVAVVVLVSVSLQGSPVDGRGRVTRTGDGLPIARGGAVGPEPVAGPRAVFVMRDKVFVDGKSYPVRLPWDTGAHVGKLGVAYPQTGDNRPTLLRRDGSVVPLAPARPAFAGAAYDGWVAADGNGPLVGWAEQTRKGAEVVAFDTSTMKQVGRRTLPCVRQHGFLNCPRPYVVSDGVVFVDTPRGMLAWDPVAGTSRQLGKGVGISQAHQHVLTTFEDIGNVDTGAIGPEWEQARAKGIEGLLSYDGGWLLDANGNPKAVNWRDRAESITYRPPGTVTAAEFDTDGSVLVVTHDGGRYTGWDCKLDGPCRTVVAPGRQEIRLVAWDL
jgi:hypothetical protein